MAKKLYNESDIAATAAAIRLKTGGVETLKVSEFAAEIQSIETGGGYPEPTGSITITTNGTHDVKDKASAVVNVQPALETKTITTNGTYTPSTGKDGFSSVTVNVAGGTPVLEHLNVTENNTYTPGTGVDGFDQVVVNVQPDLETKTITTNGIYTPSTGKDGFSSVTVNVSGGGGSEPIKVDTWVATDNFQITNSSTNNLSWDLNAEIATLPTAPSGATWGIVKSTDLGTGVTSFGSYTVILMIPVGRGIITQAISKMRSTDKAEIISAVASCGQNLGAFLQANASVNSFTLTNGFSFLSRSFDFESVFDYDSETIATYTDNNGSGVYISDEGHLILLTKKATEQNIKVFVSGCTYKFYWFDNNTLPSALSTWL